MRIITHYTTGTPYAELAAQCVRAFAAHGVFVEAMPYASLGDWTANNLHAAQAIHEAWGNRAEPICYIDADVRPNPNADVSGEFARLESIVRGKYFLACEYRPGQPSVQRVSTGIMVWRCDEYSEHVFDKWHKLCSDELRLKANQIAYSSDMVKRGADQYLLNLVLEELIDHGQGPDWYRLPDGYNSRSEDPSFPLWHVPASRIHKHEVASWK